MNIQKVDSPMYMVY